MAEPILPETTEQHFFRSAITGRPAKVFRDERYGQVYLYDGRETRLSRLQGPEILRLAKAEAALAFLRDVVALIPPASVPPELSERFAEAMTEAERALGGQP